MKKPTIEEITEYLVSKKNYCEFQAMGFANQFWHFYESNGWKVGKNLMKSWHSAIVTWQLRDPKLMPVAKVVQMPKKEVNVQPNLVDEKILDAELNKISDKRFIYKGNG